MKKNIPFCKAAIDNDEIREVVRILKSGWLTMGNETITFEKEFATYINAKHAIAVNSCTAALFLSLKALEIGKGDEVIVPSFTFVSTVNVVLHAGATPVFADIEKTNFTLDPASVEKYINKKTKAVIPVHYAGIKAAVNYRIPVVEDSAHLVLKNGNSDNLRCYSFYVTKNMTTGEGGMIATNNDELAAWLVKARLHGMSKNAIERYGDKGKWRYDVEFPGYKYNMTDINAALGIVQLRKLPELERKRNERVELYNKLLEKNNKGNYIYPIMVENREKFIQYMLDNGVHCSVHFIPVHKMSAYKDFKPVLPVTDYIGQRIVSLPLYPDLSLEDIEYICGLVKKIN